MKALPVFAFCFLGLIWGSNFIYIKLASEMLTAIQIVFYRVLFGMIPVVLFALYSKVFRIEHWRYWKRYFIMSLLVTTVYYFCFAKGTSLLYSGIAGLLSGTIPLFSFLIAWIFLRSEKLSWAKGIGLVLGFIGVVLIARPFENNSTALNTEGVVYMLLGSLSVGFSFVYAKKYIVPLKLPSLALTSYQLFFALIILILATDFDGINEVWHDQHIATGLVIGLGLLGTGVAYIIYYYIVSHFGAVQASSSTYIPPVVALFIGAVIVDEPLVLVDYIATLFIFAGIYLLNRK